jgi:predicted DNA-binding transcriptional regulator AlpA
VSESKKAAAQVALAKKAARAAKAASRHKGGTPSTIIERKQQHLASAALVAGAITDRKEAEAHSHASRAPPGVRLLSKADVRAITNVTYVTIWKWMLAGIFPRSRIVGGKAMWRSDDIDAWLDAPPMQTLKSDKQQQKEEAAA